MTVVSGSTAKLLYEGQEVARCRGWTKRVRREALSVTNLAQEDEEYIVGRRETSVDVTLLYDVEDQAGRALLNSIIDNDPFEKNVSLLLDSESGDSQAITGYVERAGLEVNVGNAIARRITFKGSDTAIKLTIDGKASVLTGASAQYFATINGIDSTFATYAWSTVQAGVTFDDPTSQNPTVTFTGPAGFVTLRCVATIGTVVIEDTYTVEVNSEPYVWALWNAGVAANASGNYTTRIGIDTPNNRFFYVSHVNPFDNSFDYVNVSRINYDSTVEKEVKLRFTGGGSNFNRYPVLVQWSTTHNYLVIGFATNSNNDGARFIVRMTEDLALIDVLEGNNSVASGSRQMTNDNFNITNDGKYYYSFYRSNSTSWVGQVRFLSVTGGPIIGWRFPSLSFDHVVKMNDGTWMLEDSYNAGFAVMKMPVEFGYNGDDPATSPITFERYVGYTENNIEFISDSPTGGYHYWENSGIIWDVNPDLTLARRYRINPYSSGTGGRHYWNQLYSARYRPNTDNQRITSEVVWYFDQADLGRWQESNISLYLSSDNARFTRAYRLNCVNTGLDGITYVDDNDAVRVTGIYPESTPTDAACSHIIAFERLGRPTNLNYTLYPTESSNGSVTPNAYINFTVHESEYPEILNQEDLSLPSFDGDIQNQNWTGPFIGSPNASTYNDVTVQYEVVAFDPGENDWRYTGISPV